MVGIVLGVDAQLAALGGTSDAFDAAVAEGTDFTFWACSAAFPTMAGIAIEVRADAAAVRFVGSAGVGIGLTARTAFDPGSA